MLHGFRFPPLPAFVSHCPRQEFAEWFEDLAPPGEAVAVRCIERQLRIARRFRACATSLEYLLMFESVFGSKHGLSTATSIDMVPMAIAM